MPLRVNACSLACKQTFMRFGRRTSIAAMAGMESKRVWLGTTAAKGRLERGKGKGKRPW